MTCQGHFKGLVERLNQVISDKWPESLDGGCYPWASSNLSELMAKSDKLELEANALWLNGCDDDFQKLATEWGRLQIDIHKRYAVALKQREAA